MTSLQQPGFGRCSRPSCGACKSSSLGPQEAIPQRTSETLTDFTSVTCQLLFRRGFSPLRTEDAGEVTKRFIINSHGLNPVTGVHRSRESIDHLPR